MNIICKLFGHKYSKKGREDDFKWQYGSTHCLRCGYYHWKTQKIYWGKPQKDEYKWDKGGYIDISKGE